jgi:hypothetical protein
MKANDKTIKEMQKTNLFYFDKLEVEILMSFCNAIIKDRPELTESLHLYSNLCLDLNQNEFEIFLNHQNKFDARCKNLTF